MPDQDSIIAPMIPQRRPHCAMGWLALIVLLLNASHVDAQNAPLQKLREQFERISSHTDYFDAILSNSSSIASNIGLYVSSDVPSKALDIKNWSKDDAVPMAADLPLFWNPSTRQFQIRSDQLAVASDAKIYFTWNFLLAYETLAPDLRQSGSALAIGMAALVASEHIYRTNWAYLPEELHDAAASVYLLSLSNTSDVKGNDLIKLTHTGSSKEQLAALVMRLLHDACPAELATDSVLRQIIDDAMFIGHPQGEKTTDVTAVLAQLRHRCSQSISAPVVNGIRNLTIRALLLETIGESPTPVSDGGREPEVHGGGQAAAARPKCTGNAKDCGFDWLLDALEEEQTFDFRDSKGLGIAPDISVGPTVSDPTVLSPLLVAAASGALRAKQAELKQLRESLGKAPQDERDFDARFTQTILKALTDNLTTARILKLAGRPPEVTILRNAASGAMTATLTWKYIGRIEIKPGEPLPRTETVSLVLVAYHPDPNGTDTTKASAGGGGGGESNVPGKPGDPNQKPANREALSRGENVGNANGAGNGTGSGGSGMGTDGKGVGNTASTGIANVASESVQGVKSNRAPITETPRRTTQDAEAPKPPAREDPIELSAEAREDLQARTNAVRFALRQTGKIRKPDQSTLLDYVDKGWQQSERGSWNWIESCIDDLLKERTDFLGEPGGPYASRLHRLLRDEFYAAAWLHEVGADSVAQILLQDTTELAVYAGVQKGREDRLTRLDLPLVLNFPAMIRGRRLEDGEWIAVSKPVREIVDAVVEDGREADKISLNNLYTYWTERSTWRDQSPYLQELSLFGDRRRPDDCWQERFCQWFFNGNTAEDNSLPGRKPH